MDENNEDNKFKKLLDQLVPLICEAISTSSTEDKIWVPLEKIRDYVETYYDGNTKDIEKSIVPTLRLLVEQELIIRKANTFCFMSAETADFNSSKEQRKSPQKTLAKNSKNAKKSKK